MLAIYNAYTSRSPFNDFIEVLRWIEETARLTINALLLEPPLESPSEGMPEGNWMEVCIYLHSNHAAHVQ